MTEMAVRQNPDALSVPVIPHVRPATKATAYCSSLPL